MNPTHNLIYSFLFFSFLFFFQLFHINFTECVKCYVVPGGDTIPALELKLNLSIVDVLDIL